MPPRALDGGQIISSSGEWSPQPRKRPRKGISEVRAAALRMEAAP
eukprot:CAMPEP_0172587756 /NCGR_PEP_ID=MMETSP1068-20121228/6761_1 /TAXON_ID=35684 /ORGANISM="Pseudopedinella elastica, Strain CCMP716" /LENGTH=44 /DNA_ID= /DNA_START= /DNA_END= /DNA_ORIENTATION=